MRAGRPKRETLQRGGGSDIPGMPQFPGNEDWNALTEELEKKGFTMADVMKLMMGEELMTGGEGIPEIDRSTTTGKESSTAKHSPPSTKKGEDNFQETIQKTMERMQESGDKATAEVNESGNDDVLMQILKAMESSYLAGAGEGDDGNLDKLFMGIMEQLSNKEMLYEPLKELDDKFGPWLRENKDKIGKEDRERYELQASLVSDIVRKFEEMTFSDDNPNDRAYIWEKMQKVCRSVIVVAVFVLTYLLDASRWKPSRRSHISSIYGRIETSGTWPRRVRATMIIIPQ